ncbi:MAG TPA: hypothetical protein VG275_14915 [Solirubrobacteraceae bacterium]|jgi:hypothetical protein|nr:hypothetical protein [Solirubrobacteraceae bacterium]
MGLIAVALAGLAGASGAIAAGSSGEKTIARAINLRLADVPGFSAQHSGGGGAADPVGARIASCQGAAGSGTHPGAVDASSPYFAKSAGLQDLQAQSIVEIERSPSIVQSDLVQARGARARACLRQAFNGLKFSVQGLQVRITHARVTALGVPAPGANGSFGIRMKLSITTLGLSVPMTADIIGVGVGRDELTLLTTAIAEGFPAQTERRLTSLLVSRARANPH